MAKPYRIGPLGQLVALPSPGVRSPVNKIHQRIGSVTTGLDGTRTRDTLATKLSWAMAWPAATPQTRALLRALSRPVWGPLRLVDPHEVNLLPADASAGGSETMTADQFAPAGGTVAWVPITDPPAGLPLQGAVAWTRTATTAAKLAVASAVDVWRVPLVDGQQLTVSGYIRGTGGQVALGRAAWDTAGASANAQTSAVTLHATDWARLELPYTAVAGRVALSGLLTIAAGQTAGTVQTTGWQINRADAATDWALGAGCPEVFADLTKDVALPADLFELELTLLEV